MPVSSKFHALGLFLWSEILDAHLGADKGPSFWLGSAGTYSLQGMRAGTSRRKHHDAGGRVRPSDGDAASLEVKR